MIVNGAIIGKRIVALSKQEDPPPQPALAAASPAHAAARLEAARPSADNFSVAEPTTKTLREPLPVSPVSKDTH